MSAFGPIARYYDELMAVVPYRMWTGYYLLLLSHQGIKPETILDVCCGTGAMCELLTQEGFKLAGFDLSEPMIAIARRKAAKLEMDIRYEVADAATFDMGEQYDAAYSFFDSLNYITEPAQLMSAIGQVGKHLRPGGSFVFDVNTAYAFEANLFNQQQLKDKKRLRYQWHGDWDPVARLIHVRMKFWKGDEEFEETHVQRAYSDEEIRAMLDAAGFVEVRAFHSYTLNPPRFKSDRIHYMCVKA